MGDAVSIGVPAGAMAVVDRPSAPSVDSVGTIVREHPWGHVSEMKTTSNVSQDTLYILIMRDTEWNNRIQIEIERYDGRKET